MIPKSTFIPAHRALQPVSDHVIQEYVDWVMVEVLPFWMQRRATDILPFVEHRTLQGEPDFPGYLRLRTAARQVAVYSQAARMGCEWAEPVARAGWKTLEQYFWKNDGGWYARIGRWGQAIDMEFSLYDQALAINACAHWAQLSNSLLPIDMAFRTLEQIDQRLSSSEQPGWRTAADMSGRDQKSHMQLLDALLTLNAVVPALQMREKIRVILDLLETCLIDEQSGAVIEWFDKNWQIDRVGAVVEPGHQFQWVWLISEARRAGFDSGVSTDHLLAFADIYGWCPRNDLLVDACRTDGSLLSPNYSLKSHCMALRTCTITDDRHDAKRVASRIFRFFAARPFAEGWVDRFDDALMPAVANVSTGSIYHLFEGALALIARGWASLPEVVPDAA